MDKKRKVPLTFAEHQAIGKRLYLMAHTLQSMGIWIGHRYRTDKTKYVFRPHWQISQIRSRLNEEVRREFYQVSEQECWFVYYPGHNLIEAVTKASDWDLPSMLEALATMATDLRGIASQLFRAYPVALGNRLLRIADKLDYESIELPSQLGQPKRR